MVVVVAVELEGDAELAGAEGEAAGLDPGDEAQVGLAVVGEIDLVDGGAGVDLLPLALAHAPAELGAHRVGAHPHGPVAGGGDGHFIGGGAVAFAPVGDPAAAREHAPSAPPPGIPRIGRAARSSPRPPPRPTPRSRDRRRRAGPAGRGGGEQAERAGSRWAMAGMADPLRPADSPRFYIRRQGPLPAPSGMGGSALVGLDRNRPRLWAEVGPGSAGGGRRPQGVAPNPAAVQEMALMHAPSMNPPHAIRERTASDGPPPVPGTAVDLGPA